MRHIDRWRARSISLSCIVSVDEKQLLRIPHKSFSDFFLDRDRSLVAMRRVSAEDEDLRSYVIDHEEVSTNLAIACLCLMNGTLNSMPAGSRLRIA